MARYPRWQRHANRARDNANILRAIGNILEHERPTTATPGGDPQALRGIPAIGPNVTGAIPGTIPHQLDQPKRSRYPRAKAQGS